MATPDCTNVGAMNAALSGSALAQTLRHQGRAPLAIGHRGASDLAPENTLAAFRAAWADDVQWVETDVQPTSDLVPVLFHDESLERISAVLGQIRGRRLTELAALDAGSWFSRMRGLMADTGPDYSALRIPTLHEFLCELPATAAVLLEIKGPHTPDELAIELAVIRATRTRDRVWLHSFEVDVLAHLHAADPGGWLGLLRDDIDADPVQVCRELGVSSYHPEYTALLAAPHVVAALHDAGISVVAFTANAESDWAALTELGVDGIITDRPAALRSWQHDRG